MISIGVTQVIKNFVLRLEKIPDPEFNFSLENYEKKWEIMVVIFLYLLRIDKEK